jgi:hypothetical protein
MPLTDAFDNTAPTAKTLATARGTAHDNTAPTDKSLPTAHSKPGSTTPFVTVDTVAEADYETFPNAPADGVTINGVVIGEGIACLFSALEGDSGALNGVYVKAADDGPWARHSSADGGSEIEAGVRVVVTDGTKEGEKYLVRPSATPFVLGTTPIVAERDPSPVS